MTTDYFIDDRSKPWQESVREIARKHLGDFRRPIRCSISCEDGTVYALRQDHIDGEFETVFTPTRMIKEEFAGPLNILFIDSDGNELNMIIERAPPACK